MATSINASSARGTPSTISPRLIGLVAIVLVAAIVVAVVMKERSTGSSGSNVAGVWKATQMAGSIKLTFTMTLTGSGDALTGAIVGKGSGRTITLPATAKVTGSTLVLTADDSSLGGTKAQVSHCTIAGAKMTCTNAGATRSTLTLTKQ